MAVLLGGGGVSGYVWDPSPGAPLPPLVKPSVPSLFSRNIAVSVLSSGSAGNCTYIGDGHAGMLVDCGVSTRQILKRMEDVGLGAAPIDAVVITHEHTDHCGAARVLSKALAKRKGASVPFYMTQGTRAAMNPACVPESYEAIRPGERFKVRHFDVEPYPVPHDAADPVCYQVRVGGTAVGVITDLGRSTSLIERLLQSLTVAVLEFNHDTDMLMGGRYPWPTKQRIRSSHGHLSNDQAGELLARGVGTQLRHVLLAHLSGETNTPATALVRAHAALAEAGAGDQVAIQVARQDAPLRPVQVRADSW